MTKTTPITNVTATLTLGGVEVEVVAYAQPGGDVMVTLNRDGVAIGRVRFGAAVSTALQVDHASQVRRDVVYACATGAVRS